MNNKRANPGHWKWLEVNPSPMVRRLLWHPYSLDTTSLDHAERHERFEKPGVHLFWVLSGKGTLETQGCQYPLQPGPRVWFADMMYPRTYSPAPGQRLVKRGLRFGGPGVERWLEQFGGPQEAQFILEDLTSVDYAWREIWQLVKRKTAGWEWQVHLVLTRILGLLLSSRNLLSPGQDEMPAPVARILNALAANPFYDWKVRDLAAVAGVSYSGLRSLFYQSQHQSLHRFIQHSRFDQARLLLSDPRLSVKQIAEQLHFSSEFYFSHFFKKLGGMSPSEFRRQLKTKV
jgi:AraC family transcriptional regulator, arabinose operon regulatory protein